MNLVHSFLFYKKMQGKKQVMLFPFYAIILNNGMIMYEQEGKCDK